MKPLSWQYIAGLLDGEGSVEITNKLAVRIRICNTYKPVIYKLKSQLGGSVHVVDPGLRGKEQAWKIGYIWTASGSLARTVLQHTFPFLVIKKAHARLVRGIIPHVRGVKLSVHERKQRTCWKQRLSALKHRGPVWNKKI